MTETPPDEGSSFEQGQEEGFEGEQRVDNNEEQTLTGQFTPNLKGLQPDTGAAGDTVHIAGNGLSSTTSVKFGDAEAEFEANGDVQLVVTAPEGTGTVTVTVTNPNGTTDLGDAFTYADAETPAA